MDTTTVLAIAIFLATIVLVITGRIEPSAAALAGVAAMIWCGIMTDQEAFLYVDWNVMAILLSIWIIAGYFGKTGIPESISRRRKSAPRSPSAPRQPSRTRRSATSMGGP